MGKPAGAPVDQEEGAPPAVVVVLLHELLQVGPVLMEDPHVGVKDEAEAPVAELFHGEQVVEAVVDPLVEEVYLLHGFTPESHVAARGEVEEVQLVDLVSPAESGLDLEEGLIHVCGDEVLLVVSLHHPPDEADSRLPEVPRDALSPFRGDDTVTVRVGQYLPRRMPDPCVPGGVEPPPLLVDKLHGVLPDDLPGAVGRVPVDEDDLKLVLVVVQLHQGV
ncbi:hypothetical protein ES707_17489 [subsurface metagenome]